MQGLDDQIGWIRWTLLQQGILDRSLIIFTGDNGCEVGCEAGPFRGKKGTPYEGGTRVPLIVTWPVRVAAGGEYEKPVSLMDIFPTVVAAARGGEFESAVLDGVNLLPFLFGAEALPHPYLFFSTRPSWAAVKADQWKLYQTGGKTELYNLDADIGERHNVAKQNPELVSWLKSRIASWRTQLGPKRH
jgi:arylsulfatase A-like enzyme